MYHLAESKKTTDILDISNQSSKDGIRIVIELRRGADAENLCNLLYKKTRLEDTFGVNMLAVAEGRPETLGLLDVIRHHVKFQYEMNTRKYQNLLQKEMDRKEIQEGLIQAVDVIDLIIEILRGSKDMKQAKNCLIHGVTEGIRFRIKAHEKEAKALRFTERQATAILQMRLYRLIGLELEALEAEHEETLQKIAFYNKVLGSRAEMAKVIIKDLKKIRKDYAVPRKTVIADLDETAYREEGPKEMEVTFLMDRFGYVRTVDKATYERNREAADKNHRCVLPCMNTDRIMIFTNRGSMHMLKVLDLPFGKFRDKGTPVDNLTNYSSAEEEILYVGCFNEIRKKKLLFATRNGMVKLVDGSEFDVSKRTTAATKLSEGDELIYAGTVEEEDSLVLQSDRNYFLRIHAMDIPEKKKTAIGVRGMKTEEGEKLASAYLVKPDDIQVVRIKDREVNLNRLHLSRRDTRGTRR